MFSSTLSPLPGSGITPHYWQSLCHDTEGRPNRFGPHRADERRRLAGSAVSRLNGSQVGLMLSAIQSVIRQRHKHGTP